eukprot:m.146595 g.146595  ORF g.146595 m.146595 type:complete len:342 (-) comp16811_c0_seq3:78-1103(-)
MDLLVAEQAVCQRQHAAALVLLDEVDLKLAHDNLAGDELVSKRLAVIADSARDFNLDTLLAAVLLALRVVFAVKIGHLLGLLEDDVADGHLVCAGDAAFRAGARRHGARRCAAGRPGKLFRARLQARDSYAIGLEVILVGAGLFEDGGSVVEHRVHVQVRVCGALRRVDGILGGVHRVLHWVHRILCRIHGILCRVHWVLRRIHAVILCVHGVVCRVHGVFLLCGRADEADIAKANVAGHRRVDEELECWELLVLVQEVDAILLVDLEVADFPAMQDTQDVAAVLGGLAHNKVALLALHQLVLDGIPRGRAGPPRLALNPVHRGALSYHCVGLGVCGGCGC